MLFNEAEVLAAIEAGEQAHRHRTTTVQSGNFQSASWRSTRFPCCYVTLEMYGVSSRIEASRASCDLCHELPKWSVSDVNLTVHPTKVSKLRLGHSACSP